MNRTKKRLFSLIELLVAISIVTILAGMVLGGLSAITNKMDIADTKANIMALQDALLKYYADKGVYPAIIPATKAPKSGLIDSSYFSQTELEELRKYGVSGFSSDGSLLDAWGNPILLIYEKDYASYPSAGKFKMGTADVYQNIRTFQIISGGKDGVDASGNPSIPTYGSTKYKDIVSNFNFVE